ncbi:hypothetical protein [Porcipelethomonas sp.]|uniref:hypothetical protein n=1 Tax=Porcipelethomonas sp. TaxID=2981675 RepID=UPI003EF9C85C
MKKILTIVLAFIGVILISIAFNSDSIGIAVIGAAFIVIVLINSFKHLIQSVKNAVKVLTKK